MTDIPTTARQVSGWGLGARGAPLLLGLSLIVIGCQAPAPARIFSLAEIGQILLQPSEAPDGTAFIAEASGPTTLEQAAHVDQVGFNADHDFQVTDDLRFVQLTPPGSCCSIVIGTGITKMAPGSQTGLQVVVDDAEAVRKELASRGVETTDVDKQPWGWFTFFTDPDGNRWACQQMVPQE